MKFWLVVNVRICERLHCNHWKYILKDTREGFSIAPRWLHFREPKWGCIRVRWSRSRCNHGSQYRGNCHPGARSIEGLTTVKPLWNNVQLNLSFWAMHIALSLIVKIDYVLTIQKVTILYHCIIQRWLQGKFRCPPCQSLLSIMWNSTLMKMSKLEGLQGKETSTSRNVDYLTFPP